MEYLDKAYLLVLGLLTSLGLQLILLVTGELRKWRGSASVPGWLAYVLSDMVAMYQLGVLSRSKIRMDLNGLWSAFLIYHLGGPDNFTAYERADSELWIRHLLNLILQVSTATYVIGVSTRGWMLLPTLLVFVFVVVRYWERNLALRYSSRQGLNTQLKYLFSFMEIESGFAGFPNDQSSMLEYVLAGDEYTARATKRGEISHPSFVTTGDVERELVFSSQELRRWACWLTVASASTKAYLRRFIGLARAEQFTHQVHMRTVWFENRLSVEEWLYYMEIEQGFLYGLLHTKPINPERHVLLLTLRIFESLGFVAAFARVYVYAKEDMWLGYEAFNAVTYVLLVIGFVVEMAYVMRLLFSRGAAVAMLVTLVRAQRAAQRCSPWLQKFYDFRVGTSRLTCVGALHISMFMDPFYHRNRQYNPRSSLVSRVHRLLKPSLKLLRLSVTHSQRGWDTFCLTHPKLVSREEGIREVQAGQDDALKDVLELILLITQAKSNREDESARVPSCMPGHSPLCCNTFLPFYSKDWEHVLVTWFTATLKLLCLERMEPPVVTDQRADIEAAEDVEGVSPTGKESSQKVDASTKNLPKSGVEKSKKKGLVGNAVSESSPHNNPRAPPNAIRLHQGARRVRICSRRAGYKRRGIQMG